MIERRSIIKPVDFATGLRPAAQWFRSVAFLVEPSADNFSVPAQTLGIWIGAYDQWYKSALGVNDGRRLHLLYHREVSIVGPDLLRLRTAVNVVAKAAATAGLGCSVSLPLSELIEDEIQFDELVATAQITTIGVIVDDDTTFDAAAVSHAVSRIVRNKGHISFIGAYERLQELRLLDHPDVSGTQLTIHPKAQYGIPQIPLSAVLPCFGRFRLYVDPEGDIYPCLGLCGVRSARLGSVLQPISETSLAGADYPLDLGALAHYGPNLRASAPTNRLTGLPWACERHRLEMLQSDACEGGIPHGYA